MPYGSVFLSTRDAAACGGVKVPLPFSSAAAPPAVGLFSSSTAPPAVGLFSSSAADRFGLSQNFETTHNPVGATMGRPSRQRLFAKAQNII